MTLPDTGAPDFPCGVRCGGSKAAPALEENFMPPAVPGSTLSPPPPPPIHMLKL